MVKVLPAMIRLGSHRTVWDLVARHIRDERLRQAFTFEPLLVGGNPFDTTSIYLLIHWLERKWGVHFALGGTTSIVNGMTRLLGEMGVDIRYQTPVESIEMEHGRVSAVRTLQGERLSTDIVVCNADPAHVYEHLVPAEVRRKTSGKAKRMRASMSLFVGYFGVRGQYPDLAHHTILLGPRYRELLDDIFRRRVLAQDFSLYLHAPTRTDARLAPPGHDAFYVLSPVPNNRSGIDWTQEAEPYFERILESLEATLLPEVRSRIVTRFTLTPHEFEHDLRTAEGAAFGPEPVLTQSAYFRWHNRSRALDGLYFVGAGTHPGAGVPGVLCSAKVLDRVVPDTARSLVSATLTRAPAVPACP
jgi:phytoene desaturase